MEHLWEMKLQKYTSHSTLSTSCLLVESIDIIGYKLRTSVRDAWDLNLQWELYSMRWMLKAGNKNQHCLSQKIRWYVFTLHNISWILIWFSQNVDMKCQVFVDNSLWYTQPWLFSKKKTPEIILLHQQWHLLAWRCASWFVCYAPLLNLLSHVELRHPWILMGSMVSSLKSMNLQNNSSNVCRLYSRLQVCSYFITHCNTQGELEKILSFWEFICFFSRAECSISQIRK